MVIKCHLNHYIFFLPRVCTLPIFTFFEVVRTQKTERPCVLLRETSEDNGACRVNGKSENHTTSRNSADSKLKTVTMLFAKGLVKVLPRVHEEARQVANALLKCQAQQKSAAGKQILRT